MKSIKSLLEKFTFLYLILYIYPYGFEYVMELTPDDISFWTPLTTWFGETFFGWEFNPKRLMKGFDSKYDVARFTLIAILSFFGAILWQLIQKRVQVQKPTIKTLMITIIRYHVGLTLVLYGLAKVLVLQFGQIDLLNLETKLGSFTGMNFLWRFMSYSEFYTQVTGYIEVIAGILLLFRGTTFLGTALALVTMVNVVFMDIGYDVTVKMFAIHLLLMVLVLVAYGYKRIVQFFKSSTTDIAPVKYQSLLSPRFKIWQYVIKAAIIVYFSISQYNFQSMRLDRKNATNDAPTLTGVYKVNKFTVKTDDASVNNDKDWATIFINGSNYLKNSMVIEDAKGQRKYFAMKADTINKLISFYPFRGKEDQSQTMYYKKLTDNQIDFNGVYEGDSISVSTKFKSKEDYRLIKNKITWIRDLK